MNNTIKKIFNHMHTDKHLELIKKETFGGNILMLGFGSVNRGVLPVLFNGNYIFIPPKIRKKT